MEKLKNGLMSALPLIVAFVIGTIVVALIAKSKFGPKIGLSSYDAESFDEEEDDETLNWDTFDKYVSNHSTSFESAMAKSQFESLDAPQMSDRPKKGYSSFTIKVTRTGTSDTGLTVNLFGILSAIQAYQDINSSGITDFVFGIMGGYKLTEGTPNTFTSKTLSNATKCIFKYANDTVTITAQGAINYPAFVFATTSDMMLINGFRMSVENTTTGLLQFGQDITVRSKSIFGKLVENVITPETDKTPNQFQTNIVDIPQKFYLDKNTTFNFDLIDSLAQTITFTFRVQKAERLSATS